MDKNTFLKYAPHHKHNFLIELVLNAIEVKFFGERLEHTINDHPIIEANKLDGKRIFDIIDRLIFRCNYIDNTIVPFDVFEPSAKYNIQEKMTFDNNGRVSEAIIDINIHIGSNVFDRSEYRGLIVHELRHFFDNYADKVSKRKLYDQLFGKYAMFDYNKVAQIVFDRSSNDFEYAVNSIVYYLFVDTEMNAYIAQGIIEYEEKHIKNSTEFFNKCHSGKMCYDLKNNTIPVVKKSPMLLMLAKNIFYKDFLRKKQLESMSSFSKWFIEKAEKNVNRLYQTMVDICSFLEDANNIKSINEIISAIEYSQRFLYEHSSEQPLVKEYMVTFSDGKCVKQIPIQVDLKEVIEIVKSIRR